MAFKKHLTSAVFAAALVGGGLIGGATTAAADTYTGCLTPGGTITKLALGDTPRGEFCPPRHLEITLGGGNGNGGTPKVTRYKVEREISLPANGAGAESVDCEEGETVISGGVNSFSSDLVVWKSMPTVSNDGWVWGFKNVTNAGVTATISAVAYCTSDIAVDLVDVTP